MKRACKTAPLVLVLSLLPSTTYAPTPRIRALAPVEIVAARFEQPAGVAVDETAGIIFVSDRKQGTVRRVAPDGTERLILRGLKKPVGLALDGEGRLLIVEEGRGRLLRREPSGSLTVLASGMRSPRWIAIASEAGGIYVTARGLRADDRARGGPLPHACGLGQRHGSLDHDPLRRGPPQAHRHGQRSSGQPRHD